MDISRLNQAGLKATRPRLRVLEVFESSAPRHLSAEEVYQRVLAAGADVGVASVYRILAQLEAAGLVRRHNFDGAAAVFEMNDGQRHDHLVCVECGRVVEFKDRALHLRQDKIAGAHGYELDDEPLLLRGRCPSCLGRRRGAARRATAPGRR
jgi:Fur family ferric uptake transcriptional regulator